jgi:hypothetical protein
MHVAAQQIAHGTIFAIIEILLLSSAKKSKVQSKNTRCGYVEKAAPAA